MSISLYSAASGMEGQQMNLNVISNNIANVGTTAFKKSKIEFQDMFYQQRQAAGADAGGNVVPTGVQVGSGTNVVSTSKVFTQGQISSTESELDLAIAGDGFFQVSDGSNEFYTRDGAFKVGPGGIVVTSQGMAVTGMPVIDAEVTGITIGETGQVTLTRDGEIVGNGQIELYRFNNPAGLMSLGGNLYQESEASGTVEKGNPAILGFGRVQQGYLETSNVNIVEEMVNMIMAQRAYEVNSKSIQTSDSMLQQVAQIKR